MIGLGSFAVSNFAVSGTGYFMADDPTVKHFHEMNVMWNTVNLGLAVPGYLKAIRVQPELTLEQMRKEQRKTEQIFLINSVLDLGYMSAGLWMRKAADQQGERRDLFQGYGSSLLFQGSFLLAFDAVAYAVHRRHGQQLVPLENLTVLPTGTGVCVLLKLD